MGGDLFVVGWIPVRIKEHKSRRTDEIETTSASLAAEQKRKLVLHRIVEFVHQLLALSGPCRAVEANKRHAVEAA